MSGPGTALHDVLACPSCKQPVRSIDGVLTCTPCHRAFEDKGGVLEMFVPPTDRTFRRKAYLWSDEALFESLLEPCLRPAAVVVEVCAGPNIVVPHLLRKLEPTSRYLSIGNEPAHLAMQRQAVEGFDFVTIHGDASSLMLRDGSADVVVFHHAINDIWVYGGHPGVARAIDEALRVVRRGGALIFSHCVFEWDNSTIETSLDQVADHLRSRGVHALASHRGRTQDWLVATT